MLITPTAYKLWKPKGVFNTPRLDLGGQTGSCARHLHLLSQVTLSNSNYMSLLYIIWTIFKNHSVFKARLLQQPRWETYPCFKAILIKPFLLRMFKVKLPGCAFRDSSAPPITMMDAWPPPSLFSTYETLSLDAETIPSGANILRVTTGSSCTSTVEFKK